MKTIEVVAAILRKGDRVFATQRGYGDWKDLGQSGDQSGDGSLID